MSAPNSIGLIKYGVVRVESTTKGKSLLWATFAKPSKSATLFEGFETTSVKINLVFGFIDFS